MTAWRETALLFGETRSLVGVLTEPRSGEAKLGCLLLNSGYIHHVGPQRLYVKIARRLAQDGVATLRFDYSSIGDSAPRTDGLQFADASIREAQDALDVLQRTRGIETFAAAGVCWGGDNAVRVCHADPRVMGALAVDFYMLPSLRHWLRLYPRRMLRARSWLNLLSGSSHVLRRGGAAVAAGLRRVRSRGNGSAGEGLPEDPISQIRSELDSMTRRGAELSFVFTRGGSSWDHYVRTFRPILDPLAASGHVQVELLESDHIMTLMHSQRQLVDLVAGWAGRVAARARAPAPVPSE